MSLHVDVFEPLSLKVEEASGEVDGKYVIGRVAGPFFVPNGKSRNERFYPRALWERVCADSEVQKRLAERRMFGTAGHGLEIDDAALRLGCLSHVVTKLEIRGDVGYGEALILDTPVGRNLNTLLRAGCKLFVSSRANGDYAGETKEGIPIVNPETYQLQTFDFVLEPGFLEANPKLVENHIQSPVSSGVSSMDFKELFENVSKENASLKAEMEKVLRENESVKANNVALIEENKHMSIKADRNESLGRQLEKYKALGTHEEIARALERADKVVSEYKKLGTTKEISKALDLAHATIGDYKKFGEAKEVKLALEKAAKALKIYQSYGSIPEMKQLMDRIETDQKKLSEAKRKDRVAVLAKELSVSEESIKMVYGKMSEADIRQLFKGVSTEQKTTNRWVKTNEDKPSDKGGNGKKPVMEESRGKRLMKSLCK